MTKNTVRGSGIIAALAPLMLFGGSACANQVGDEAANDLPAQVDVVRSALLPREHDTPLDRRQDCFLDCFESCQGTPECSETCVTQCTPKLPSYLCQLQDNSYNHAICQAGNGVWNAFCHVECKLIPIAFLIGLCDKACDAASSQFPTCPDASICV